MTPSGHGEWPDHQSMTRPQDKTRGGPVRTRRQFLSGLLASGAAALGSEVLSVRSHANAASSLPAGSPVRGGTFTIAETTDIDSFDPFYVVENNYTILRALNDTLTRYNDKLEPQPELAESWELAKDASSITLKLRRGVRFHSGREMTAEDVLFSITHVQDKKHGSQLIDLFQPITKVTAQDKYTVTLEFPRPYVAIFDALDLLSVLDSSTAADLKEKPAGCGPFVLVDRVPGDRVTLKRFDGYWRRDQPYLDQLIHRTIPDAASLVASLRAGEVDLIWKPPLPVYQQLKRQPGIKTDPGLIGDSGLDISMNVSRKPFTDKRVRQAINWATDRERLVKTILYDAVPVSDLPFPPYSPAYFPDLAHRYRFDLERAKRLLTEAGYGSGLQISAITSGQQWPTSVALAQIVQESLARIGVRLQLQDLDPAAYYERDHSSNFDMMFHSFGRANKEPVTLFGGAIVWRPKNNVTTFSSPQYSDLIAKAGAEVDRIKRRDLYRQIDGIILEECWTVPVAFQPRPWAMSSRVQNFAYDRQNVPLLQQIWLAK